MSRQSVKVRWVRRNWPIGAVPFIIREDDLPRNQKVLVFLPHSDDGRFIGATLSMMNRTLGNRPRNEMRIVVVCPGYHSVEEGHLTNEEKASLRFEEALCWGSTLGFHPDQAVYFGAERSYETRRCVPQDQKKMDEFMLRESPTMVFVPHVSDIAQHTNASSRTMIMRSLTRFLGGRFRGGEEGRAVFVVEYPTLHVPILPPADKTVIVAFTDPTFPAIKHEANKCHKSIESKHFDMLGHFVEAIDALSGADTVLEARRTGDHAANSISEVSLNPVKSRGEHFGITQLGFRDGGAGPVIVEERLRFPLAADTARRWFGTDRTP